MKNKKNRIAAAIGGLMLCASFAANATLEPRLSGMAYYDTVTDLTWMAPEHTLYLGMTYAEYADFMPTFILRGTGDWEIPTYEAYVNAIDINTTYLPDGSTILPPIAEGGWYLVTSAVKPETTPFGYFPNYYPSLPYRSETYPFPERDTRVYKVLGVHRGDVPLVAVPEPSTYAMLLAGLGLFGYIGRRQAKQ